MNEILTIFISIMALLAAVFTPFFLIRSEKIYGLNKEYAMFVRYTEIYLLEWMYVAQKNLDLIHEFLIVHRSTRIFPKTFEFYDVTNISLCTGYNMELVNEFYVLTRRLKNQNHHLQMIEREYRNLLSALMTDGKIIENSGIFFEQVLLSLETQHIEDIKKMGYLRLKVQLLAKSINKIDGLAFRRYFCFSQQSRYFFKKDLQFTQAELAEEKIILEAESKQH